MRNAETRLDYANTEPSLHYNFSERRSHERWRGAWIYCLKHFDYEAAELIVSRNLVSDECEAGDHDECFFRWCVCSVCHSRNQFHLEHPHLRSLREAASEMEEEAFA